MQPSSVTVRHTLHHVYAFSAILLMLTGLLLTLPDLRARLIGGYGREILDVHLWAGWIFLAAPLLALALAWRLLLAHLRERWSARPGLWWRRIHLASVLGAGLGLGGSGVVLWWDPGLPRSAADMVADTHEILSWFVIFELGAHLIAARRKIVERTVDLLLRRHAGRAEEVLFEFADDD